MATQICSDNKGQCCTSKAGTSENYIITYMIIGFSLLGLIISFFWGEQFPAFSLPWGVKLPLDPSWIAIIVCGYPIVKSGFGSIARFELSTSVLITLALFGAIFIGETFAAGEVAFIMYLGGMLEKRTVRKAREGLELLINLSPRTARVLRNEQELIIPAEQVQLGDVVRVLPGETIAVDGRIVFGETAIDQSLMTGESLPVDKFIGDDVFSGTVNQLGAFDMEARKVGQDSSLQRMIQLVETADAQKTPVMRIMDIWARRIVIMAVLLALATYFVSGELVRAVTVLVVLCPCALVLATPTAIMAGIGRATKFGILISSADALERLAKVTRIAFDKTGTLTFGKPQVSAVASFSDAYTQDAVLALVSTAEQRSEHPLGKAVVQYAKERNIISSSVDKFLLVPGRGVQVQAADKALLAGNKLLMQENAVALSEQALAAEQKYAGQGASIIFLAVSGELVGLVALADTVRPDAKDTIARLHEAQVQTVLLTGDNGAAAQHIASQVGITDVRYNLLPEGKVDNIAAMQADEREKVCMIGDGINDAPALKTAYIGLAMGGVGSDIAVDAADGVLIRDDIMRLPYLIKLARKTAQTIRVNIFLSMAINLVAIFLAVTGFMGPVVGALAHNLGAFIVVFNSTRLLRFTDK